MNSLIYDLAGRLCGRVLNIEKRIQTSYFVQ